MDLTQQETSQMQFMLDISRSMSKAYADLVSNFLSTLTNLVLIRRDAYLKHTYSSLDSFRIRNLRSAPISGGDLFDRSLMQEYEQHLIGLGIKPGSKKDQRFHPYKKGKRWTTTASPGDVLPSTSPTIHGSTTHVSVPRQT